MDVFIEVNDEMILKQFDLKEGVGYILYNSCNIEISHGIVDWEELLESQIVDYMAAARQVIFAVEGIDVYKLEYIKHKN